jgi:threonine dehydratase
MAVELTDVVEAQTRIKGQVARTPFERSVTLSAMTGAELWLKAENLQFTASFKERGALNRLLDLSEAEAKAGVIAMSAGNHAQALAYHGRRLGIPTTLVMPRSTPNAKVEQTRVFGAQVILFGAQFDETLAFTEQRAKEQGSVLVHPFDDARVIAGQGTVALEMLEQHPALDTVLVPVGGGGLIGGVATVIKAASPAMEVVGVQAARYPAAYNAFHGKTVPSEPGRGTVAEGIAVKVPGALTTALIEQHVDDFVLVAEDDIERAVFSWLEVEKTLVEGAGAVGLGAVLADPGRFGGRHVGLILSGGNVDMMVLSSILQRGLVRTHRLARVRVEIPDIPGALGEITQLLGELDSNIIDITHQRAFGGSSVRAAVVELVLQLRGEEQVDQVLKALATRGFDAERAD